MQTEVNGDACQDILERSRKMKSGLGAIAFAVLEMFRQSGMDEESLQRLWDEMEKYFPKPSNEVCNAICQMVETRLSEDKIAPGRWYK